MSWRTVRLGELVENFSVRAKDVGGAEGLDFYGVSNEEGIIKTKYAAEDKAEDYKIIEKGCFAYNPYRVNVGSIGLVSDETRGLISPAYVIFKPKPKSIIPELLFKFLKSAEGLRQIIFYARGTVRQALRFEDLCNIEISIPDYSEQQGLYNKLINSQKSSNILDAELKNQLELLKNLRQQLLQDAVQGKLVKQDPIDQPASELLKKIKAEKEKLIAEKKFKKETELPPIKPEEIPFEIPENWNWCRLNDIISILGDGLHGTPNYDSNGAYYFINGNNLINGKIEIKENTKKVSESEYLKHRKILISNTVFVSINGTLGNLAYYNGEKIILGKSACYFNLHPEILREYIGIYIKSSYFLKYAVDVASETTIKNVSLKSMRLLPVPFPPLAEQNRIVKKLDELMQNCNKLEASIKQSESQNEKLLQQVLREALR